jgi:hypothetical protein
VWAIDGRVADAEDMLTRRQLGIESLEMIVDFLLPKLLVNLGVEYKLTAHETEEHVVFSLETVLAFLAGSVKL